MCRCTRPHLEIAEEGPVEPTAADGGDEARVGPPDGRHREQEEDEAVTSHRQSLSEYSMVLL